VCMVADAGPALPQEARAAARLLHPQHTWLQTSQHAEAVATVNRLGPAGTVWSLLALHLPPAARGDVLERACPATSEDALEPGIPATSVDALERGCPATSEDALEPPRSNTAGLPWTWIYNNTDSALQARQSWHKLALHAALCNHLVALAQDPPLELLASKRLRWPAAAAELLAGARMPIMHNARRRALQPLFVAAATCMAASNSPQATQGRTTLGHWIGLLELAYASLACLSEPWAAQQVLHMACEELQAHVNMLSSHEVASSVMLLGELLGKQVWYPNTCSITLLLLHCRLCTHALGHASLHHRRCTHPFVQILDPCCAAQISALCTLLRLTKR
jgi:hypothetical protein